MMINKNKKGISAIIATVMIILITISVSGILMVTVVPMVKDTLDSATLCTDAVSQVQIVNTGYTCVNRTSGDVAVQIKRGAKEFDFADAQILISAKGTTKTFNLIGDATSAGVPITVAELPLSNEERVFDIVTGMTAIDIEKVQIAPIITTGSTEKICDVAFTVTLKDC